MSPVGTRTANRLPGQAQSGAHPQRDPQHPQSFVYEAAPTTNSSPSGLIGSASVPMGLTSLDYQKYQGDATPLPGEGFPEGNVTRLVSTSGHSSAFVQEGKCGNPFRSCQKKSPHTGTKSSSTQLHSPPRPHSTNQLCHFDASLISPSHRRTGMTTSPSVKPASVHTPPPFATNPISPHSPHSPYHQQLGALTSLSSQFPGQRQQPHSHQPHSHQSQHSPNAAQQNQYPFRYITSPQPAHPPVNPYQSQLPLNQPPHQPHSPTRSHSPPHQPHSPTRSHSPPQARSTRSCSPPPLPLRASRPTWATSAMNRATSSNTPRQQIPHQSANGSQPHPLPGHSQAYVGGQTVGSPRQGGQTPSQIHYQPVHGTRGQQVHGAGRQTGVSPVWPTGSGSGGLVQHAQFHQPAGGTRSAMPQNRSATGTHQRDDFWDKNHNYTNYGGSASVGARRYFAAGG
eukprot:GHVN01014477.1.p1 GENE.GHVN01014477.1~~GHVN01014477.1.p1  ORF type:complete len:466 (-),score=155.00 GHVN01014477.1:1464-2825(-)